MNKGLFLQDPFLNALRKEKVQSSIEKIGGVVLASKSTGAGGSGRIGKTIGTVLVETGSAGGAGTGGTKIVGLLPPGKM